MKSCFFKFKSRPLILTVILFCSSSFSHAQLNWPEWVAQLRVEAIGQGVRPALFDSVFKDISSPSPQVLHFDRTQPERRITFYKYRSTRADQYRLKIGQKEYQRNSHLLNEVGHHFGVSPCFITALWGLETSYGRFMGSFPVIKSLATLAYDNRRSDFFRGQLLYALQILNGGHVRIQDFKGEWAGASGQCQFLPSSWQAYAVDYDRDGRKDIWKSRPDVFASIANYLAKNGWAADQPWAIQVDLPGGFNRALLNASAGRSVAQWQTLGLRPAEGRSWPDVNLSARLIQPDGGPAFLVFNNFNVLMKWNRSTYYAATVGYAAEQICGRRL